MGIPKTMTVQLEDYLCCYQECDAIVYLPAGTVEKMRRTHEWWYCYRGHRQHFSGQSKEEELKKKLADMTRFRDNGIKRLEWKAEELRKEQRSKAAIKGQVTKIKKRVKNGVCPCCNRSFKNLGGHMSSKHPTYGDE